MTRFTWAPSWSEHLRQSHVEKATHVVVRRRIGVALEPDVDERRLRVGDVVDPDGVSGRAGSRLERVAGKHICGDVRGDVARIHVEVRWIVAVVGEALLVATDEAHVEAGV